MILHTKNLNHQVNKKKHNVNEVVHRRTAVIPPFRRIVQVVVAVVIRLPLLDQVAIHRVLLIAMENIHL